MWLLVPTGLTSVRDASIDDKLFVAGLLCLLCCAFECRRNSHTSSLDEVESLKSSESSIFWSWCLILPDLCIFPLDDDGKDAGKQLALVSL